MISECLFISLLLLAFYVDLKSGQSKGVCNPGIYIHEYRQCFSHAKLKLKWVYGTFQFYYEPSIIKCDLESLNDRN